MSNPYFKWRVKLEKKKEDMQWSDIARFNLMYRMASDGMISIREHGVKHYNYYPVKRFIREYGINELPVIIN